MKNKNLNLIVKASIKSDILSSILFCVFLIISFTLVAIAVGTMIPLGNNIEIKINQHIINREINVQFPQNSTDKNRQATIEKILNIENVVDIYEMPTKIPVNETGGVLSDNYELGWLHRYYIPQITGGRAFMKSETGVALVPDSFEDFNASKGIINSIDGSTLVGKTLKFELPSGMVREFEVIGSYDTTDPIFSGKEILVPQNDLYTFTNEISLDNSDYSLYKKEYIVVVDNKNNVEAVCDEIGNIAFCYTPKLGVDTDSYNVAFIMMIIATSVFVVLTVFGFYMFLRSNIKSHTKELALYRTIGYKTKDLINILLSKYLLLVLGAVTIGIITSFVVASFIVNPYLDSSFGDTFMEMTLNLNLVCLFSVLGYISLTVLMCILTVKQTENIDLTVLLKT